MNKLYSLVLTLVDRGGQPHETLNAIHHTVQGYRNEVTRQQFFHDCHAIHSHSILHSQTWAQLDSICVEALHEIGIDIEDQLPFASNFKVVDDDVFELELDNMNTWLRRYSSHVHDMPVEGCDAKTACTELVMPGIYAAEQVFRRLDNGRVPWFVAYLETIVWNDREDRYGPPIVDEIIKRAYSMDETYLSRTQAFRELYILYGSDPVAERKNRKYFLQLVRPGYKPGLDEFTNIVPSSIQLDSRQVGGKGIPLPPQRKRKEL